MKVPKCLLTATARYLSTGSSMPVVEAISSKQLQFRYLGRLVSRYLEVVNSEEL